MGKRGRGEVINKTTPAWSRKTYSDCHLLCLNILSGNVLFTRKIGHLKTLPLSTIGLLNGLDLFTKSCSYELTETRTADARIVWKDFHNSLRFILITNDDGLCLQPLQNVHHILEHAFNTLVLFLGIEAITTSNNFEKLKKDVQVCFPMIDLIVEQLNQNTGLIGDLVTTSDCIISPDNAALKNYLTTFAESVDTLYSCILVRGKTAVATQSWTINLNAKERMLISLCISMFAKSGANEQLIYLPYTSPTVPYRLTSFQLVNGIHLCMLIAHSPTLHELQLEVPRFWQSAYIHLKSLFNLQPRNFPQSWIINSNIMTFLLVDLQTMKSLVSYQTSYKNSDSDTKTNVENSNTKKDGKVVITSIRKRQELLRSFYKHVIATSGWTSPNHSISSKDERCSSCLLNVHECTEMYVCIDNYKCYALQSNHHQLFIICSNTVPIYALRSICHKTYKSLTSDKHICL